MNNNVLIATKDGSNTLFSSKYKQNFHNENDGAINESLYKHVIPAFSYHSNKSQLNILDICFGLGYNTLLSVYYVCLNNLDIKLNIYSPELDSALIKSLVDFPYPKELIEFKKIITSLSSKNKYEDKNININLFNGNARNYIKTFDENFFDIVYQDAFSSNVNKELWTKEYFEDIYKITNKNVILTTYSISTPIRLSLFEANFFIYEALALNKKITLATKKEQNKIGIPINMKIKKERNPEAKALYDFCL